MDGKGHATGGAVCAGRPGARRVDGCDGARMKWTTTRSRKAVVDPPLHPHGRACVHHGLRWGRARVLWPAVPARAAGQGAPLGVRPLRPEWWPSSATAGHDPSWTGRSTGSANPDDTAGTPVGGWVKRRDMFKARCGGVSAGAHDQRRRDRARGVPGPGGEPWPSSGARSAWTRCPTPTRPARTAAQLAQGELVARGHRQDGQRCHMGHRSPVHRAPAQGDRGAARPAAAKPRVCKEPGHPPLRQAVRGGREPRSAWTR